MNEEVDSLCTRDRNIRDALDHAKMLQELTITSSLWKHTTVDDNDGDGSQAQIMNEELLKNLKDFDINKILDRRFTELSSQEQVVLTLFLINQ